MASSDEQLQQDVQFGVTRRSAGVTAALEIRLYDNGIWSIGNTPRNDREEVLADLVRALDVLEQHSAERRTR